MGIKADYANLNIDYVNQQYESWRQNPSAVDEGWQKFFEGFELGLQGAAKKPLEKNTTVDGVSAESIAQQQWQIDRLIAAYRDLGHLMADLDPLNAAISKHPDLDLSRFGFTDADLQREFTVVNLNGPEKTTLANLVQMLRDTYCRTVGVEYMHIQDVAQRRWLQSRLETSRCRPNLSAEKKLRVLRQLFKAEMFEAFVHNKFLGQKRFSLEGAEAMIPALDELREQAPEFGIADIVIGMPHRGRLTVLANIVEKSVEEIFDQFEDNYHPEMVGDGSGDVKYHMGASCDYTTSSGKKVHISLASNPSHLEAVNPVALGRARGKQRRLNVDRKAVLPLLIHGDAAFAGQGLVMECLQLSQLEGYRTGGTVHLIVNNQLGFTTDPKDGRSTRYCTDIAKMASAPVFHVNANDPEAVLFCIDICLEFRQAFGIDTFVDMIGYRKYGHNETDEPSYTQPVMYEKIAKMKNSRQLYMEQLVSEGILVNAEQMQEEFHQRLEQALRTVRTDRSPRRPTMFKSEWDNYQRTYSHAPVQTGVGLEVLDKVVEALFRWPEGFHLNKKITKQLQTKQQSYFGTQSNNERGSVDWGMAELLSIGSLLVEGAPVRLSGQDSRRGTFSQRHSVLYDALDGSTYIPLNFITPNQQKLCVYNSPLSEAAVLGFDYGYSLEQPGMLIMWEAQFGDFVNGAQVIIDQFLTSAEMKWQRSSGLVLLLPHGSEGMGPEHSSARLERFLQSCAEDNIQVCNLTTPAQYFHVLRRQIKRNFRKPLVIMTPKSLLRHRLCISPVTELVSGGFSEVLDDAQIDAKNVRRVLVCSGKVYYDLLQHREDNKRNDVAIIRLEQFYPWPGKALAAVLGRYRQAEHLFWVQEEPKNMGGWSFVAPLIRQETSLSVDYVGRPAAASPAVGSLSLHKLEQETLVKQAFSATPAVPAVVDRNVIKLGTSK